MGRLAADLIGTTDDRSPAGHAPHGDGFLYDRDRPVFAGPLARRRIIAVYWPFLWLNLLGDGPRKQNHRFDREILKPLILADSSRNLCPGL